jgi:hypothetical protein
MKVSELRSLIREVLSELSEANTTGGGASFTPGSGAQYATPFAFSKGGDNRAVQFAKKIGYTKVKTKKRPYSTKLIDYLNNENAN